VTSPTVNVEADVAEQKNTVSYNVINRPPQVTASSSPAVANPDQEVSVTCQATDPDCANDPAHTDRVSRIKWSCADKQGKNTDCYFGKDDVWHTSAMTENLQSTSVVANPYDSTVKFKASSTGAYSVGCEATDNDPLNPLTAKGVTEVIVADNSNTNSDTGGIKYCSVLADTGERDRIVCVKAQSDSSTVNYKAYTFGMDPQTYRWRCFLSDNVQESSQDSKQCTYPIGYFMPYLSIIDKSGEEINCNSTISTKVTCIPKCSVVARETGSADDYSSEAPVSRGKDADAIIKQECLEEGDATWNVVGGTVVSQNSRGLEAKFNDPNVAQGKIGARINKNGVVTICDDAVVNIKDKMKWAQ
jgi:hypothetical protein